MQRLSSQGASADTDLAPDTLIRTLLGLLVKPETSTQERRALADAVALLRTSQPTPTQARASVPFVKLG